MSYGSTWRTGPSSFFWIDPDGNAHASNPNATEVSGTVKVKNGQKLVCESSGPLALNFTFDNTQISSSRTIEFTEEKVVNWKGKASGNIGPSSFSVYII